jgi:hypothetical protein
MKCLLVYSLVLDFWDRVSLCNPRLALNSPFSSLYFPGIHLKCYFKHADSMMSPFRKALATSTLLSGKTRLPRNILMTSMPPLILKLHSGQVFVCELSNVPITLQANAAWIQSRVEQSSQKWNWSSNDQCH